MRCCVLPRGVVLFCYIMLCATACFDLLDHVTLRHGMVLCAVFCCLVISFHVILVYVVMGYVTLDCAPLALLLLH